MKGDFSRRTFDSHRHFSRVLLQQGRGLLDGSLWIVTADHGEGLGNHAFMGHGKAYEEDLRVPLFFHAVDGSIAARRVTDLTEHVDLRPTLIELAGLPAEPARSGRSLVPSLPSRSMLFSCPVATTPGWPTRQ